MLVKLRRDCGVRIDHKWFKKTLKNSKKRITVLKLITMKNMGFEPMNVLEIHYTFIQSG